MATSGRHRSPARSRHTDGDSTSGRTARCRRHELITAAGGAMLLVVIGLLSGWAHHSLSNPGTALPRAAVAAPAAGVAEPLTSSRMGAQLRTWLTRARPSIDALIAARRAITTAAATGDVAVTGAACDGAAGAVTGAQQHLPAPDPGLTSVLQQAIDSYLVGLHYCVLGVQGHDGTEIAHAARYMDQGNTELHAALAILDRDLAGVQPRDSRVLTV